VHYDACSRLKLKIYFYRFNHIVRETYTDHGYCVLIAADDDDIIFLVAEPTGLFIYTAILQAKF